MDFVGHGQKSKGNTGYSVLGSSLTEFRVRSDDTIKQQHKQQRKKEWIIIIL